MSALALSVLLALVSAVAYAAGAIVQERVASTIPNAPFAPLRHGAWWAAVALNGVGALLHVGALAYGPLSLVQPLGALTIVFALPLAAVFVRSGAGAAAWRGALLATAGLAGLLSLTGSAEAQALDGGEQLLVGPATAGAVAALFLVAQRMDSERARSVVLAVAAGVAFGIGSVFTKTVAADWPASGPAPQWLGVAAVVGLAAVGMLLSQASYRGAGLAAPLATVTVVNPVVAAAVGITLFGERFRYGATGAALALCCGAVAAAGLILLARERPDTRAEQERQRPPGPERTPKPAPSRACPADQGRAGPRAQTAAPPALR
ncbi:DMT family transporter [Streptomyces hypolithicus]